MVFASRSVSRGCGFDSDSRVSFGQDDTCYTGALSGRGTLCSGMGASPEGGPTTGERAAAPMRVAKLVWGSGTSD